MIEAFNNYVKDYDMSDPNIKLKYDHSFRVMELNRKYAQLLGWNDDDVELATLIGLLHDIGRFEQLKVYHTFVDFKSVDHADYSVEQLFDKGLIKKFCNKEEWYPIIKFAIKNHNKLYMEECDDERILKHAKLIKDSDKVDIIYLLGFRKELNQKCSNDPITPEILEIFRERKLIPRDKCINKNDKILAQYAFIFDVNYNICLEDYKKNIIAYHEQMDGGKQFEEVIKIVLDYIDERLR